MQKFPDEILLEIRRHLEEEKTRIVARINELSAQDPFADPDRVNDNAASDTEASEESKHDNVAAIIAELAKKQEEIDASLERIRDGTYGYCRRCKTMIDTDRLGILPTATLCLCCEKEKGKKD
ncbi:TraR/DksA C4-type zinc finger protein [Patescibacteria group bacterium]|nr:TraR/DksA C4-type zinc finger protein [Patescibacteria group bacterium]MBU1472461.1 TraR/DksA C4-type zinc finger protein [Patescibacteria group bacterium]MBU2460275.1 TraR/DksA C4-type zinc finger protein [Patescibacteria group bacterium]MBU2544602.1 TraR/DksA C4-type zinc finger protein [Patescibacteria group bacterium]